MASDPRRIQEVFLSVVDLLAPARAAALQTECGDDQELRRRVEALLLAHQVTTNLLDVHLVPPQVAEDLASEPFLSTAATDREVSDAEPVDLSFLEPPQRPDSKGRLGHYEVLEVLGHGGFGTVLKAFDEKLQRLVAIKVMAPEMAVASPARKRFLREARAAAAVRHENIVQIHAVEETPIPYLVMEYVPGSTLQQHLDARGPLDVAEMLTLATQITQGLAAAHAQGLIHRDVKPANILLEAGVRLRAKITDFGLARAADDASLTQTGVVSGTPHYMSPEQAKGESVDQRSDLFSLGSVFYVMLTGRLPYRASSTFGVLKRVVEDTPRPMREIIPEIPPWLCALVACLHQKSPCDRFPSATEVIDQLDQPAISAATSPSVGQRSPRLGRVTAALGLLLATGGALMVQQGGWMKWFASANTLAKDTSSGENLQTHVTDPTAQPPTEPPRAIAPFEARRAAELQDLWARHLDMHAEFDNSLGMRLRLIPPGEFLMGSSLEQIESLKQSAGVGEGEGKREASIEHQGPQHLVRITRPFAIGIHEVTVGQFRQFVEATGHEPLSRTRKVATYLSNTEVILDPELANWDFVGYHQTDAHPGWNILPEDAEAFCQWLSEREGKTYELPTEAQWEFACRAGTTDVYFWGNDARGDYVWLSKGRGGLTHPVGQKLPNAFGLYDMCGNVSEYCADRFAADYYQTSPTDDPQGPVRTVGGQRVNRGGSVRSGSSAASSADRRPQGKTATLAGFRIVQTFQP